MIIIEKTLHGTVMKKVWFAEYPVHDNGIIQYRQAAFAGDGSEQFLTLVSDLTDTEEDMLSRFSKGCRYKVNRAYRENIEFKILDSKDIKDDILDEYLDFFEDFWKSKGITLDDKDSLFKEMKAYIKEQAFTLAYALVDGERAVYHTHIYDEKTARLFHSASLFRLRDGSDNSKNIIGMANRALHYEEMKFFKNKGLSVYDWGGAGKSEDVASITEFKESFGGESVTCYDFIQVNGTKAKMINALSELKHKIKG